MMKVFGALIVASLLANPMARAMGLFPAGPATVKIGSLTQATGFHEIGGKTNETATSTNIMAVDIATVSSTPFVNSNLLALLANSFNTNFPAGWQIGIQDGNFVLVDSTGTNVVFNPSSVLSISNSEGVYSSKQTQVETIGQNGVTYAGNNNTTTIADATINYDDSAQATGDSQHTQFQLRGLAVEKLNSNLKTSHTKIGFEFQGSGGGNIRGVQTVFTATITSKAAGSTPPPP